MGKWDFFFWGFGGVFGLFIYEYIYREIVFF